MRCNDVCFLNTFSHSNLYMFYYFCAAMLSAYLNRLDPQLDMCVEAAVKLPDGLTLGSGPAASTLHREEKRVISFIEESIVVAWITPMPRIVMIGESSNFTMLVICDLISSN